MGLLPLFLVPAKGTDFLLAHDAPCARAGWCLLIGTSSTLS